MIGDVGREIGVLFEPGAVTDPMGSAEGLMRVSLDSDVPVTFGILTSRSEEDALVRSAPGPENKGAEAAAAAHGAVIALRSI